MRGLTSRKLVASIDVGWLEKLIQPKLQWRDMIVPMHILGSCIPLRKTRLDNGWKIHITSSLSKILTMGYLELPFTTSLDPFELKILPIKRLQVDVLINARLTSKHQLILTGRISPTTLWYAVLIKDLSCLAPQPMLMQIYSVFWVMDKLFSALPPSLNRCFCATFALPPPQTDQVLLILQKLAPWKHGPSTLELVAAVMNWLQEWTRKNKSSSRMPTIPISITSALLPGLSLDITQTIIDTAVLRNT